MYFNQFSIFLIPNLQVVPTEIFLIFLQNGEWKFGVKDFSSKNKREINIFPHPVKICNLYKLSEIFEDPGEMIEIIDDKEDFNAALLRRMSKMPEQINKSTVVTKMLENEMDSLAAYHDEKNQEKIREMQENYGLIPKIQQDNEKVSPFHFAPYPYK